MEPSAASILVIEDDLHIQQIIKSSLEGAGYCVHVAVNGVAVFHILKQGVDALILDVMLKEDSGLDICQRIRGNGQSPYSKIPIMIVSARAGVDDRLVGFELGADDYLTKPFDPRELVARVQALINRAKRKETTQSEKIEVNKVKMELDSRLVLIGQVPVSLKPQEFDLFKIFLENPGMVYTRETLLKLVWDYVLVTDSRTVDVHISRLRRKLRDVDPAVAQWIKTVPRVGYQLEVPH